MKQLYNIVDFGAVAGGEGLQTAGIQAAIDAAFLAGGGEVVVPAGVFRSATIKMRSNVTLRLLSGAVIEGSTDPEDYTHFLEDELEVYKRAANSGHLNKPKNASAADYRAATGFEAVIGMLYWIGDEERVELILSSAYGDIE